MCKRFKQKKIYVIGESWGSALGLLLIQRYPKLYHAFIGTGQMVSFSQTEIRNYELALKMAKDQGDATLIEKLKKQGMPPYYGKGVVWKVMAYTQYLGDNMTINPEIDKSGYTTLRDLAGPEYGLYDKANFLIGLVTTFNQVYPQLYNVDFRKQAVKLDVPMYFMEGRHDINAPPALTQEYFNVLKAPHKEFIWFEHSGHSPWINERDKFIDLMVNSVLKQTKTFE